MKKRKFNLSGPIAIVIALLILAIFVPINLIVSYYDKVYDMLFVNPGAAGNYGIHHLRTAIRLDIEQGEIKNMEIGEWPKHLADND